MRQNLEATRDVGERIAQQTGDAAQQMLEALRTYGEIAQRMAAGAGRLASAPLASHSSMHGLTDAWRDWLSQYSEANARYAREIMGARSLPSLLETHARFLSESLDAFRETSVRVLKAAGEFNEQAASSFEGENEEDDEPQVVSEVMSRNVKIVSPDDTIADAAKIMATADTGILPVGENDKLVGMLSDRDIAVRLVAQGKDPSKASVRDAMTKEVKYCFEDEELQHVAENMAEQRLRRLPVVNREKRLVGIVSVGDLATELGDPYLAGQALRGAAQSGGPHRQRLPSGSRAQAGSKPKARRQERRKRS
jgi:CBS domain-containing protein